MENNTCREILNLRRVFFFILLNLLVFFNKCSVLGHLISGFQLIVVNDIEI